MLDKIGLKFKVGAFEVAPQHVAGAQLARTQFLRRLGLLER